MGNRQPRAVLNHPAPRTPGPTRANKGEEEIQESAQTTAQCFGGRAQTDQSAYERCQKRDTGHGGENDRRHILTDLHEIFEGSFGNRRSGPGTSGRDPLHSTKGGTPSTHRSGHCRGKARGL